MDLQTFHQLVADTALRGGSLASFIPVATRQAVLWTERNYTFQYMRRYATFLVDKDSPEPRAISFPNERVKGIDLLRLVMDDGCLVGLRKVDPQEITFRTEGRPTAFWLDGTDFIWFDKKPVESYSGEIVYNERSNWAALGNSDTHWLLTHAEDFLLYQTMLQISPYMRDPTLQTIYKPLRDEALRTLILDDDEMKQGPARREVMRGR